MATQQGPAACGSKDQASTDSSMGGAERTLGARARSRRLLSKGLSLVFQSKMLDPSLSDVEEDDEDVAKDRVSMFQDRRLAAADSSRKLSPQSTKKPFLGLPYSKREYAYAICVGVLLSFNAGYVNGSCLSGLVAPSGTERAVTSHTGTTTKSALNLSAGDTSEFGFLVSMLLCFSLGSFIAGSLTPKQKSHFESRPAKDQLF